MRLSSSPSRRSLVRVRVACIFLPLPVASGVTHQCETVETGNSINKTAIARQAACGTDIALVFHPTSAFHWREKERESVQGEQREGWERDGARKNNGKMFPPSSANLWMNNSISGVLLFLRRGTTIRVLASLTFRPFPHLRRHQGRCKGRDSNTPRTTCHA